jgi:hypothetical protein
MIFSICWLWELELSDLTKRRHCWIIHHSNIIVELNCLNVPDVVQLSLSVGSVSDGVSDFSVLAEVWNSVTKRILFWLLKALSIEFRTDRTFSLSERFVRS